ncbi:unnamed protein product [Euphydryas editha]|uniref:Uncharacterized protein n=1 Tax=Euphydryas editha TaxID=104508 RepID=A0AAU9TP33_EUPED|nr:unnamed protein product [Euphydryas editha]
MCEVCFRAQEVDACGCDGVSEEVVAAALDAVRAAPRAVALWLAGTAAAAAAAERSQVGDALDRLLRERD